MSEPLTLVMGESVDQIMTWIQNRTRLGLVQPGTIQYVTSWQELAKFPRTVPLLLLWGWAKNYAAENCVTLWRQGGGSTLDLHQEGRPAEREHDLHDLPYPQKWMHEAGHGCMRYAMIARIPRAASFVEIINSHFNAHVRAHEGR